MNSFHGYLEAVNTEWLIKRQMISHFFLCCPFSPTVPSTDLVSVWDPSCRGNSHLCILADWPLVSHRRGRPSLDLSGGTGVKTWERKGVHIVINAQASVVKCYLSFSAVQLSHCLSKEKVSRFLNKNICFLETQTA